MENDELGDDRSSVQRLHYLEEQFPKVSGGLLLRLERPGDAGQRLLGDRAKDGSNAASKWKWIVVGPTPSALASLRRLNPWGGRVAI